MGTTIEFVENGVKLQYSIAAKMEEMAASAAFGALSFWSIVGAAGFVVSIVKMMTEDTKVAEALAKLQSQINEIKAIVSVLDQRLDELVENNVINANRATLTFLLDYADSARGQQIKLADKPLDIDQAVEVANDAGILCDKFLRLDYDIWRWADIVLDYRVQDGHRSLEPRAQLNNFKNIPTLPVYLIAMATWLGARQRVVMGGQKHRLIGDSDRLQAHRTAVSIRPEFDKYHSDEPGAQDDFYGTPLSIA